MQLHWAEQWAYALSQEQPIHDTFDHILIFKGPKEVFYEGKELNTKKAIEILSQHHYQNITVVAHSSGSFPAHVFFQQILDTPALHQKLTHKITYYNLDGGIGKKDTAYTTAMNRLLKKGISVSVYDSITQSYSANHESMIAFEKQFPDSFEHITLNVDSGCDKNAQWCLHDVVINLRPHNNTTFDLKKDYTLFGVEHPLSIEWMIFNEE
ncbi:hypothetical protein GCM10023331_36390 [Algivirga pacifica]|uniref:Uncharacterized protein n=1 Tax=Algivirga pacifica TaxID=1162670 RepID=A0ABP9DMY6_9BACT